MKKFISILFFSLMLLTPKMLFADPVNIQGTVTGLANGTVILLDADRTTEITRVNAENDFFKMVVNVEVGDGRMYFMRIEPAGSDIKMRHSTAPFFIDAQELEVSAKLDNASLVISSVKNSATTDEYMKIISKNPYYKITDEAQEAYDVSVRMLDYSPDNAKNVDMLQKTFQTLSKARQDAFKAYLEMIPDYSKSDAMLAVIASNLQFFPSLNKKTLLGVFDKSMEKKYYGKLMLDVIQQAKNNEIGATAVDFNLPDTLNNDVTLSSLKGKYVLIDFWASWCAPCKSDFSYLTQVATDYKDKNLVVVGVSLDKDKAKWLKGVQDNQLGYTQLWDPARKTMNLYNFSAIPYVVLISPEGTIVDKGLRGADIVKRVSEIKNLQ